MSHTSRPSIRRIVRSVVRRLLAVAGAVQTATLERARPATHDPSPARAGGAAPGTAAKIEAVAEKLRVVPTRATAEHARYTTLLSLFRHYLIRLAHLEEEIAGRVALERRVKRAQLSLAVKAARRQGVSAAAAAEAARLAAQSSEYGQAVARWRLGERPSALHRVTIADLQWSAPADLARGVPAESRTVDTWLPFDELAAIRQFTVGGVMLDIGAGIGATSVPRVLLGDVIRAYAAEPDGRSYLCLIGNTLDNHLEGRVLPDRIAIAGSPGRIRVSRSDGDEMEELPTITPDAWIERLGISPEDIRFVRIALRTWNVNVLRGAPRLVKRRHIVWQIEIEAPLLHAAGEELNELSASIGAHFRHVKALGRRWPEQWQPASDTRHILNELANERRPANLLLFNLPGVAERERSASATASAREQPRGRAVISLLHPTARLPEGWKPAMRAFLTKARNPNSVEYILAVDENEPFSLPEDALRGWGRIALVQEGVTGTNSGYNAAAKVSRGQILITIADDYFPPDGWDEQVRAAIPDVTEEVVLDVENSDGVARLLPFSFLTRAYYERYGYVLYPGYHGFFGDNEFTAQARRDRVIRPARHIVFEHRHPDRGTAPMDAIYARQRSHFEEGKRLFRERKAKGFPKWPD